jgi:hypothetical protein
VRALGLGRPLTTHRWATFIGGDSYLDEQGRLEVDLTVEDDVGERDIRHHEGDIFEFAGATWRVAKIFEPSLDGRSRVATLSKVEWFSSMGLHRLVTDEVVSGVSISCGR